MMFVHVTSFHTPEGEMTRLRELIAAEYLPRASHQAGFIREYMLEKIDDPNRAQLFIVWESQAALEDFRNSQAMRELDELLRASFPRMRLQSESYIVRLHPGQ
jgi:heme-degrading monooxygenase HmoA